MVWYNLRIGSYYVKYTPLNPIEKKYPYCDSNGNLLKYVNGKFEAGYFEDNEGNKHNEAFFLINNKPYAKLSKTKETDNYKEVEINEVDDLIVEKTYIIECDKLMNDLLTTKKALKFGMSLGGGGRFGSVKTYYAYIYPSELYNGLLFMSLGTTKKSEVIKEIVEGLNEQKKLKQITTTIQSIDRAKVEDLIQL